MNIADPFPAEVPADLPHAGRRELPVPPGSLRLPAPDPRRRRAPTVPLSGHRLRRCDRLGGGAHRNGHHPLPRDRPLRRGAGARARRDGGPGLPRDSGARGLRRGAARSREPVDVVWIGLSLHHLRTAEKLAVLRAIRTILGEDGHLFIYEATSPDSEDRDACSSSAR